MKYKYQKLVIFSIISIVGISCTKFQKLRKSDDWEKKYEAAIKYYEEEDYYRSNILLEDVIPIIRGTQEAELANFYYPYTYFHQNQFILSSHYFKTFTEIYSRSEYAMEATYMHAFSLYKQSPKYKLDQTVTYEAITVLQSFINQYPYSEYAETTDKLIDELQQKLELKAFENTKLYHRLRRYEAALVSFDNFKKDYPGSVYEEETLFLEIETSYLFAEVSIKTKQEERYQNAVDKYLLFVDKYPKSKFLKEAEQYYANSVEELTKFASRNNL